MRMLQNILRALATVLLTSVLCSAQEIPNVGQKPALTWLSIDWQPAWIFEGPLKGKGYAQTVERMLRDRMTGFEHVSRSVSNVRIYSGLQNRDACFPASPYKGEDLREEHKRGVIWSAPAYLYFFHGLIARPEAVKNIQKYAADGHINFTDLIKDERLVGAFQPRRSYSRWLNPIFSSDAQTKNMFKWSGDSALTQSMFKLLEAQRIDYFVDYVIMLKFHQASTDEVSDFVYLPITEHKDMLAMGSIACSDTPVGRAAIQRINEILGEIRNTPEFRDANRRWLMPEEQQDEYWHMWDTQVLTLKE